MNCTRVFNLNGRQLIYSKKTTGIYNQDVEKRLLEIPQGEQFARRIGVQPIITIKKLNNGNFYSYNNRLAFENVFAQKTNAGTYTVSVPTKNGNEIIGYIKGETPISWTKNKNNKKMLNKITTIIKNGL